MTRFMGIDYGSKRIGIAVSDILGVTAAPLVVVEKTGRDEDVKKIADIIMEKTVGTVVFGLPYNMDGTDGSLVPEIRSFAAKIGELSKAEIKFVDERLTTLQAERMLVEEADVSREKRKQVRDKISASIILQSFLDSKP
ncbi:MAG: Holliday junction resolvase RuvX [Endomicrobiales bacterium]|nr:Holliday junction resolvase RuvX [Endomicrobiales bacterium]